MYMLRVTDVRDHMPIASTPVMVKSDLPPECEKKTCPNVLRWVKYETDPDGTLRMWPKQFKRFLMLKVEGYKVFRWDSKHPTPMEMVPEPGDAP